MVNYCNLALEEGKDDPQAISDSELDGMSTITKSLRLRMGIIETHPMLAKIGDADIGGRVIIYLTTPTTREQLRSILSHAGYYRNFFQGYALITAPLKDLPTKEARFCWDDIC